MASISRSGVNDRLGAAPKAALLFGLLWIAVGSPLQEAGQGGFS
jgi:hypothetical protein